MESINNNQNVCEFCNKTFSMRKTLLAHVRSSKRCIEKRNSIKIICTWCSKNFDSNTSLIQHYKICDTNKEMLYTTALITIEQHKKKEEEYKEEIKENKEKIKELEDKLFKIANKTKTTINTNTTINNVTLTCDKPLVLSSERILNILITKCEKEHILRGENGVAEIIVNYICRNELGNLCIECTDVKRKSLRYIDEYGIQQSLTIDKFIGIIKACLNDFRKHNVFKSLANKLKDGCLVESSIGIKNFFSPGKDCKKYIIDKTYKDSPNQLLTHTLDN